MIGSAIRCADKNHIPITARSGGHSYGAISLGGSVSPVSLAHDRELIPIPGLPNPGSSSLVVDLRAFRGITYDEEEQTVTVGPGTLVGEMSEFLEKKGRTVPCGACPTVGVGGQAVAGGFGLMSR